MRKRSLDQSAQKMITAGHQQLDALQGGDRQGLVEFPRELHPAWRDQQELLPKERLQPNPFYCTEAIYQGHVEPARHHQLAQHIAEAIADIEDDVGMFLGERDQQRCGQRGGAAERRQPDRDLPLKR